MFRRAPQPASPIAERLRDLQMMVEIADLEEQLERMQPEGDTIEAFLVPTSAGGTTAPSPFVEANQPKHSILPWRNRGALTEADLPPTSPPSGTVNVRRRGYVEGLPRGGATATNPGTVKTAGGIDRQTAMNELLDAYVACPWSSACIDETARTITAGGLTIESSVKPKPGQPSPTTEPTPPYGVMQVEDLFDYCNPDDDIRQLMRGVVTDLEIFADSFTEVTWMVGRPVALWPLDCQTMNVLSDEHGNVTGYVQTTSNGDTVQFAPREVIHVKMDAPGASLYGISSTSKALVPIKTWLFAAALVKETMRKGDPPRLWTDWPITMSEASQKTSSQQYDVRNLGIKNIGRQYETKGGAKVQEFSANKLEYWLAVKADARDEIVSTYGVPKRKVGISVPGSLGGAGAETGEDKTYRVNKCGPIAEIILEKFTFSLLYQAYGVKDWRIKFGEVDWRDDLIVEQIRDLRLRNGSWTQNRYRRDIGEPDIDGGDDAVLVDRQNLVLWSDIKALSTAAVKSKEKGTELDPNVQTPEERQQANDAKMQALQKTAGIGQDQPPGTPAAPGAKPSEWLYGGGLSEMWRAEWAAKRVLVMAALGDDDDD